MRKQTPKARAADIQPSLQQLFDRISVEMNNKLETESQRFSQALEAMVRKKVEEITAPLTQEALLQTTHEIAKGFVNQYSVATWRVRQIAQEEVLKREQIIDQLNRRLKFFIRLAALEAHELEGA